MFLVVSYDASRVMRWHGVPARGIVSIGSAREDDIQLVGHNIAIRHVRLRFSREGRARLEVRKAYGVRMNGRAPTFEQEFAPGDRLEVGAFSLELDAAPATGIEAIDDAFAARITDDPDMRLVYADSLEERGRLAEAELVRERTDDVPSVAAETPPAWRRRFLPIAIECCADARCPGDWHASPCVVCRREVICFGHLGAAREEALRGAPVAVDPAVRRWPNDLKEAVVRRPAIEMGQPNRAR